MGRSVALRAAVTAIALIALLLSWGEVPSTGASGAPLTLDWFMWTGSSAEIAAWKHVADLVPQKYPNLRINFVTTSWNDYWAPKLPSEAASHTLQCIISLQNLRTPVYANSFRPLTPYIQRDHFNIGVFDKSIISGLSYQGTIRALPYDFGPLVVFYNKDMFQSDHVALPKPGWTYNEFLADAKALTHGSQYGFAALPYPDWWLPFAVSDGATYLKPDGTLDLTNPGLVAEFAKYVDLVTKYHVAPQLPATKDIQYAREQFVAGNAAMFVQGPWQVINIKGSVKFDFGIAPIPAGVKGSITLSEGSGFGISTDCKHPDQAWQAITVLTGPEAEQYLASNGRAFAARVAQQKYWYQDVGAGFEVPLAAALRSVQPYRTTSTWVQVGTLLMQYGISAMNGSVSPAAALKQVQTEVEMH